MSLTSTEIISEDRKKHLRDIVTSIFKDNKGILAADERPGSLQNRLEDNGIQNTEENRRRLRNILFSTPGIEEHISGVIMNEETFLQKDEKGKALHEILLEKGILVGVKLDEGVEEMKNGEKICKGLGTLGEKLKNPLLKGATFTKWRSVFTVGRKTPSAECMWENAHILCQYAQAAQRNGRVPIIEPEILYLGDFTSGMMVLAAKRVYSVLLCSMQHYGIYLPGVIFKISFISESQGSETVLDDSIFEALNKEVLLDTLPRSLGGVLFLSGGHTLDESCKYLSAIKKAMKGTGIFISFSFARALTNTAIGAWRGEESNTGKAQDIFLGNVAEATNALNQ